jgi:hypothetical protein
VNGSGYRGLITIRGIGKMDDNVYTGFNLNFDQGGVLKVEVEE